MTKNGKKSNVVSIESIPPSFSLRLLLLFVYFCCRVYRFFFFFFRITRSDSFFLCKVVMPVSNCNNGLCNVMKSLIKPFFALTKK